MFCTNCGGALPDNARFCTGCGNPIAQRSVAYEQPANQMPTMKRAYYESQLKEAQKSTRLAPVFILAGIGLIILFFVLGSIFRIYHLTILIFGILALLVGILSPWAFGSQKREAQEALARFDAENRTGGR